MTGLHSCRQRGAGAGGAAGANQRYTDTTQVMGRNAIQFLKGLYVPEFQKLYGTEA